MSDNQPVSETRIPPAALHRSTASLLRGLAAEGWTDAEVTAPSWCEGWTRAHVLTHIARNADGITRTLEGALDGEIVARYPDGWDARNRAIDDGAGRRVAELLADVQQSAYRLDRALTAIDEIDGWDRPTDQGRTAGDWVWWRLREVEIHHVDLRGSYTARDWPATLVDTQLRQALDTLAERTEQPLRVELDTADNVVASLAGLTVTTGDGDPAVVRGPDWAVLAWLVGRPGAAQGRLSATPPLTPWR